MAADQTAEARLLRIPEVAARLRVSRDTVYRKIAAGQIPAVQLGDRRAALRVPEDELEAWIRGPVEAA